MRYRRFDRAAKDGSTQLSPVQISTDFTYVLKRICVQPNPAVLFLFIQYFYVSRDTRLRLKLPVLTRHFCVSNEIGGFERDGIVFVIRNLVFGSHSHKP